MIGAGRSSTRTVFPALISTDCKPLTGLTGLAGAPLTAMVPPSTHDGMRTLYVNGASATIVVVSTSEKGYCVSTTTVTWLSMCCGRPESVLLAF